MLEKKTLRAINRAKNVLIIPFPAAMRGGEYCPEQINRLKRTFWLWEFIGSSSHDKYPAILCAGGLPNIRELTLAESMKRELMRQGHNKRKRMPIERHIRIAEEESTHTGQQIRMMRAQIEDGGYDLILVVSNWWHLRGILRLMHYQRFSMPIVGVASPTAGSMIHRISRTVQETIRVVMIEVFDRQGRYFDRDATRRKAQARSNA